MSGECGHSAQQHDVFTTHVRDQARAIISAWIKDDGWNPAIRWPLILHPVAALMDIVSEVDPHTTPLRFDFAEWTPDEVAIVAQIAGNMAYVLMSTPYNVATMLENHDFGEVGCLVAVFVSDQRPTGYMGRLVDHLTKTLNPPQRVALADAMASFASSMRFSADAIRNLRT